MILPNEGTVMADPMVNVAQYPATTAGFEQPVTMMQRLQAERRKRLVEYQQKLIKGKSGQRINQTV